MNCLSESDIQLQSLRCRFLNWVVSSMELPLIQLSSSFIAAFGDNTSAVRLPACYVAFCSLLLSCRTMVAQDMQYGSSCN